VEFDGMDELEQELREVLARRPAPAGLKQKVMERRAVERRSRLHGFNLRRIAASLTLAMVAGGAAGWAWHDHQERKKGEEARRQVMLALRITGHALHQVQANLAEHDKAEEQGETQ
jgi:hypothetical protein